MVDSPVAVRTRSIVVPGLSIVPFGEPILSTSQTQKLDKLRVYPGTDADFTLYDDDGRTYAYEKDGGRVTHLHWNDAARKLTHDGAAAWAGPDEEIVEVVGR